MAKKPHKEHTWRITLLRADGRFLGTVEPEDEKSALMKAADQFELSPQQAKRILVQKVG
jgi:hypothetical protein